MRVLLRRKLSQLEVAAWENEFGTAWSWLSERTQEPYIPGGAVIGSRHEWSREPFCCKAVGCYLCGADFDSKSDLNQHWRDQHLDIPAAEKEDFNDHRVEEEMRKRMQTSCVNLEANNTIERERKEEITTTSVNDNYVPSSARLIMICLGWSESCPVFVF